MQGKRITRSRTDRILAGIAGGLAVYFNIDPLLIRLGFLILCLFNGLGVFIYFILWLLLRNEDTATSDARTHVQENMKEMQALVEQLLERIRKVFQSQDETRQP